MNKIFKRALLTIGLAFSISTANAAIVTWTFDNVYFDRVGFASQILTGTLSFDADTNTFTDSTLVRKATNLPPETSFTISLGNSSNANGLSFSDAQFPSGSLTFLTPLTNNGGTVFLSSGNFTSSGVNIWALRGEQSISAPFTPTTNAVPEPETYAMMMAGLGLAGFAARRRVSK